MCGSFPGAAPFAEHLPKKKIIKLQKKKIKWYSYIWFLWFQDNCPRGKLPHSPYSNANPKPSHNPDRAEHFKKITFKRCIYDKVLLMEDYVQGALRKELPIVPFAELFKATVLKKSK